MITSECGHGASEKRQLMPGLDKTLTESEFLIASKSTPRGLRRSNSLLQYVLLTTNSAWLCIEIMTKTSSVKLKKLREIPVFLKENISKRSYVTDQIRSAMHLMVYVTSRRGYQVLWNVEKHSREIFLTFLILMINLFPKNKFVFYNRFCYLGNVIFLHYSPGFLTRLWPSTASKFSFLAREATCF